jgi:metacaspase-1
MGFHFRLYNVNRKEKSKEISCRKHANKSKHGMIMTDRHGQSMRPFHSVHALSYQKGYKHASKKACLIGINYTDTPNRLYGCENDVQKMKYVLMAKFGYSVENITVITEKTRIKPTRMNILLQFSRLLIEAKSGDQLFFGFSGHGYYLPDKTGDETDGFDEIIITCDRSYVIDDEFRELMHKYMKPGVQLFGIFDNCHSGTIWDLRYDYDQRNMSKDSVQEPSVETNPQYKETPGQVILLSGCKDNEVSIDAMINGQYNGVLTCTFMELLLHEYIENVTTWRDILALTQYYITGMGFKQTPQFSTGRPMKLLTENVCI